VPQQILKEDSMKSFKFWCLLVVLMMTGLVQAQPAAPAAPAPAAPPQDPTVGAPKVDAQGNPNKGFMKMHEEFVQRAKKGDVDVLFLGDSITEGWKNKGKEVWTTEFADYKTANFGIGGDRTQHVLWRIENGELEGIKPKVTVLMIGTNNTNSDDPDKIAEGVENIVKTIKDKTGSKVLLLGVFPREDKGGDKDKTKMYQDKIGKINERISKLDDGGKTVRYLDLKDKFLESDGTISDKIMPDKLHPTKEGYQRWADGIKEPLAEMTK
jgi:lysophospholipase L1-like esterase